MEDNKKDTQNQVKAENTGHEPKWETWVDCLPPSKDSWRRVFNRDLKCYEVYVRKRNLLVATGIQSESDSYLIGMLPAIIDLTEEILAEIKNGEVTETTYRGIKYILGQYHKAYRKAKRLD